MTVAKYSGKDASVREACYLAGFLDGEGCFERAGAAKISVSNTCLPTLEFFLAQYGGSIRKKQRSNKRQRIAWEWIVCGDDARRLARLVFPFLREKQRQCWLVIIGSDFPARSARRRSIEQELKDEKRKQWPVRSS
jgi:hypothetical protein